MSLDEITPSSDSAVLLRRLVLAVAILQIIASGIPAVFLDLTHFQMIFHVISTAWSLFVLWEIAHFKNWARRWFIVGGLVILPAFVPLIPVVSTMMKNSLTSFQMSAVHMAYTLSILYSVAFAIFLFAPRIRALFTTSPSNTSLRILLGISAVIAVGVGIKTERMAARRSLATNIKSNSVKVSLHPNKNLPYIGFWKQKCQDNYGFVIDGTANGLYSAMFCGPGGCMKPTLDLPTTFLMTDPRYHVIDQNTIEIDTGKGVMKLSRCEAIEGNSPIGEQSGKSAELNLSRPDYLKKVSTQINSHWKPASKFAKDTICQVLFIIEPDGSLSSVSIEKSSGNVEFDQSALKTIQNAAPFPPMPPDIPAQSLKVHLKFEGKPT